jgi:cytoplasmic iron level regulating protein YaaA (DUF328/UPF0246 family)
MQKIVLIACASKKRPHKSKAKDLYVSQLFKYSLAYAYTLNPDKIYILSALHHLLDLETEIEPYNVTLSNIPKSKRKEGLRVLNRDEKAEWGKKVVEMLSKLTDLQNDQFIVLAGQEYIKPIKTHIKNIDDKLRGMSIGERISFLKTHSRCNQ